MHLAILVLWLGHDTEVPLSLRHFAPMSSSLSRLLVANLRLSILGRQRHIEFIASPARIIQFSFDSTRCAIDQSNQIFCFLSASSRLLHKYGPVMRASHLEYLTACPTMPAGPAGIISHTVPIVGYCRFSQSVFPIFTSIDLSA